MTGESPARAPVDLSAPHILVVDDDERILTLLTRFLKDQGFLVTSARSAAEARVHLSLISYNLLVVDVMMPGEDGVSLTRAIRADSPVPILMLTAMGHADDRVRGLESGADDYLPKPFDPRELVLRIRSILRRIGEASEQTPTPLPDTSVSLGACVFDLDRNLLHRGTDPVHLTTAELSLLRVLAEQRGQIISREDLASQTGAEGGPRTIDVQVTRLRKKIEGDSRTPRYLRTVRGKGYQLVPD